MISSDIPDIERLADAAWPAAEQVALGPWKLRATGGVTHRANSVFAVPRAPVPGDVVPLIEAAERFYGAR
ncbi:MAG: GNAT family N-acetyltransferase, partial [Candidatus Rokuibacteriota bacterium]